MASATQSGAAILEFLRPELEKAFKYIPPFGEIGFRVIFHENEPVRIEYQCAISHRLQQKADRPRI